MSDWVVSLAYGASVIVCVAIAMIGIAGVTEIEISQREKLDMNRDRDRRE